MIPEYRYHRRGLQRSCSKYQTRRGHHGQTSRNKSNCSRVKVLAGTSVVEEEERNYFEYNIFSTSTISTKKSFLSYCSCQIWNLPDLSTHDLPLWLQEHISEMLLVSKMMLIHEIHAECSFGVAASSLCPNSTKNVYTATDYVLDELKTYDFEIMHSLSFSKRNWLPPGMQLSGVFHKRWFSYA